MALGFEDLFYGPTAVSEQNSRGLTDHIDSHKMKILGNSTKFVSKQKKLPKELPKT